mmetsp:Transcript_52013/g.121898  ORF Transcript_52013/g.121898 Transcript_52013/m.121898 type:complete len:229 (+) Transcript_52013:616-1302(+)
MMSGPSAVPRLEERRRLATESGSLSPASSTSNLVNSVQCAFRNLVTEGGKGRAVTTMVQLSLGVLVVTGVGVTSVGARVSLNATMGSETESATCAKLSRRSLRQRSRCTSPDATMTCSPVACTSVSTHGSALFNSRSPRASAAVSPDCCGSTATRTMGAAWKERKERGRACSVSTTVAYLRTACSTPERAHRHPGVATSTGTRSRPIMVKTPASVASARWALVGRAGS